MRSTDAYKFIRMAKKSRSTPQGLKPEAIAWSDTLSNE